MNIKQIIFTSYINNRDQGQECEVAFQLAVNWCQHRLLLKLEYLNSINDFEKCQLLLQDYKNTISEQITLTQVCELNFQAYRQGGSVHEFQLQ